MIIVVVLEDADEGNEREILEMPGLRSKKRASPMPKGQFVNQGPLSRREGWGAEKKLHEKTKFFSSLKSTQLFQEPLPCTGILKLSLFNLSCNLWNTAQKQKLCKPIACQAIKTSDAV